ncbi:MAG: hypothetical protein AB7G28_15205 [Pirellulales bacterium]
MSEAKPLRWSFLATFTVTLCAMWAVVWTLARVEHSRLVSELSRRIATAPEEEATLALRQMTQLREPPIETIVVAATSPAREVARQAQDSIADLLQKWQHESKSSRGAARVAARLERLSLALDAEQTELSALDLAWLERTTERMLRIANQAPPEDALRFSERCESLLLAARGRYPRTRPEIVPVANAMLQSAPVGLFAPPSRIALQSIVAADLPEVLDEDNPPPARPQFSTETAPMPRPFEQPAAETLKKAAPMPAAEPPSESEGPADSWAALDSRQLLERWLVESGPPQRAIEAELQRRGFGRLRSDVVRLALSSSDRAARVQLVQDLPAIPGLGAKAWLMLLAEDPDAEVRQAAVTIMATSHDAELLDRAWNVALHDRDPRVARLAEQLRARRSSTRQR